MAQVDRATRANVDHLLKWAFAAWESLPTVEQEIDTWDLLDQLVFTEEWPIQEDRLLRLAQLAQSNDFTESQRIRYQELLSLVERNRPVIERIMRS